MKKIGFIGTGNMGGALAYAASLSKVGEIYLANRTPSKAEELAKKYNVSFVTNKEAAKCDYVFIGVKPHQVEKLLKDLKDQFNPNTVLVSMAAGVTIKKLEEYAGDIKIIRILPNTAVMVNEGMSLYSYNDNISKDDIDYFLELMQHSGKLEHIEESLIDAASSITGCGPAFADMFIDALADGGVACGVPRKQAIRFASQMLIGAGKLALESNKHPDQLKDEVCSPGGSTIEGVIALEKGGFRASVINAVISSYNKNKKLG